MIKSFINHNKWFDGDIVVIYSDEYCKLSEKNMNLIRGLYSNVIFRNVYSYEYDQAALKLKQKISPCKIVSMLKLEVFDMYGYDYALYLDSDMVVIDDISEIFNTESNISVTRSGFKMVYRSSSSEIGCDDPFGTGFIMVSRNAIYKNYKPQILKYISTYNISKADENSYFETVMNKYFRNTEITYMPTKYNFHKKLCPDSVGTVGDAKILHYHCKQWTLNEDPYYTKFDSYWRNESSCSNIKINDSCKSIKKSSTLADNNNNWKTATNTNIIKKKENDIPTRRKEFIPIKKLNIKISDNDEELNEPLREKQLPSLNADCKKGNPDVKIKLNNKKKVVIRRAKPECNDSFEDTSSSSKISKPIHVNANESSKIDRNGIALCAIAKNENRYIREWVEYYKSIGIRCIFLYDNNDKNGERFEDVIGDYIESKFVKVIDVRGIEKMSKVKNHMLLQAWCYVDCYKNNYKKFNWICFFDIDEFFSLKDGITLDSFLNRKCFSGVDTILTNWENYGDNDLLIDDGRPVLERFTKKCKNVQWIRSTNQVKSIVRCDKQPFASCHTHSIVPKGGVVAYSNGVLLKDFKPACYVYDIHSLPKSDAVIKHFVTKTISEYAKRYVGRAKRDGKSHFSKKDVFSLFFSVNEYTKEKEDIFNKIIK